MTKKSITTRFRITKNGKVLHRIKGQCHFRAKKSSRQLRRISHSVKSSKSMKYIVAKSPDRT